MRRDLKPELPGCRDQRPTSARRTTPARPATGLRALIATAGLVLISLMLLIAPAAQARSPEREAQKSARAAERAAERLAHKEWPDEGNAEFEHGTVQVTCTQIKWAFTGFTSGSTAVLEKVKVDHAQVYLTLSSFDGVTDYVTTNVVESPGRHAVKAAAKWRSSDKSTGHFVMIARINCPPAPAFTVEDKHQVAGAGPFTTAPIKALIGQTVDYEVLAKNTGNVPLSFGYFVDPRCDAGTTTAAANPVAPGATATYTCRHVVTAADQTAGSFTSSATLVGVPPLGDGPPSAHSSNILSASVPAPSFSVAALQQVAGAGPYDTSTLTALIGQTVNYEFLVTNTGNVELALENFSDRYCDEGTVSGATSTVAAGATATILCSHVVNAADQTAGSYVNSASVTGTPPEGDGEAITHSSNETGITVPTVDFSLEALQQIAGSSYTTAAVVAPLGQTVNLEFLVKNTGSVPLTLSNLSLASCDASTVSGGASSLAPGASTTYLCSHIVTTVDQAAGSFTSNAMLTGTPPQIDGPALTRTSNTLTASLPAAAQSSKPAASSTSSSATSGVLGFKAATVPGLVGPTVCVRGGFRVSLKAAGLKRVTFYLDGHKLKVLTARNAHNGKITLVISASKLGTGAHKVLARIITAQTASTRSAHATRTLMIKRCSTTKKG